MKKEKIQAFFAGKRGKITAAAVAGILLVLTLLGVAGARYLFRENSRHSVRALEFYFTSSLLDEGTHTLAPGSTQVTFTLANHPDDLRYSETPIAYSVKLNGAEPQGTNLTGTLGAGSVQNQVVTITDLQPGTYTITAEGTGGYHKTLTATLIVPPLEQKLYKYLDTSNPEYVLLTVWSKGYQGSVAIQAPSGMIPDNTDPVMASVKTGQTVTSFTDDVSFAVSTESGYCSHVYRFFGSTAGEFEVTYTTAAGTFTAGMKTPND